MEVNKSVNRAAVRFFGGKWLLAPWVISFFPDHKIYIEPCGGGASVLLRKPLSPIEVLNDLDGTIVNFFRVLRDQPDELIRKIDLTPWARQEFDLAFEPSDDPVEEARRFYIRANMSRHQGTIIRKKTFFRLFKEPGRIPTPTLASFHKLDNLYAVAERLKTVQILCEDYRTCIERFDAPGALIYFDPPYVHETRQSRREYVFEWNIDQHTEASEFLKNCKGSVIVSGYACRLYIHLYEDAGWRRVDKEAAAEAGVRRIESLWLSPRLVGSLQRPRQLSLTDAAPHLFRQDYFQLEV